MNNWKFILFCVGICVGLSSILISYYYNSSINQQYAQIPRSNIIFVDEPHQFIVYDSVQGKSWKAFIYNNQIVIIPGTEFNLSE